MQPDNKAAYAAFLAASVAYRKAIDVASDSPIPGDSWHDIGRGMELIDRILKVLGKPTSSKPAAQPKAKK